MRRKGWIQLARAYRPLRPSRPEPVEVCDFQVIGERGDDPQQLLLVGNDGRCYTYSLATGAVSVLDPDESWSIDPSLPRSAHHLGARAKASS